MPAPLNANELRLSTPTWRALPATPPSQEDDASYASGSMHYCYGGCIAMTRRDAFFHPYQSDPESDPEGEGPEEIQTLQDISEW